MSKPETVICQYRVAAGNEEAFTALLERHWPTLHDLDVVTDEPGVAYRGSDREGRPVFFEIFHWKDAAAFEKAHRHPDVQAIWEPMGSLCESRGGSPGMEFPHVERMTLWA